MNENNKEIEVKVLNIDKIETIKKLVRLNAPQIKKEFQVNYMFDYPDGRFFSKGGYVRIRRVKNLLSQEEKNIVTFKELISREKFKISKEIEFTSSEFEATKNFLEALGLQLFRVDEKFRESFSLEDGLGRCTNIFRSRS